MHAIAVFCFQKLLLLVDQRLVTSLHGKPLQSWAAMTIELIDWHVSVNQVPRRQTYSDYPGIGEVNWKFRDVFRCCLFKTLLLVL